jgi:GTP cyclohydrolase I
MLTPREFDLTTFPNYEGYDELVLARGIPVQSLCEHHLLPFHGVAHVGYLPGERILGMLRDDARTRQEFLAMAGVSR